MLESPAVSTLPPSLQYGSVLFCSFIKKDYWIWRMGIHIPNTNQIKHHKNVKQITSKVSNKTPQKCQTQYLKTTDSLLVICTHGNLSLHYTISKGIMQDKKYNLFMIIAQRESSALRSRQVSSA